MQPLPPNGDPGPNAAADAAAWAGEPTTSTELDEVYNVVTQCPGRLPSTMLKVVKAEPKNGDPAANVVEGQVYKLFIVGPQEIFRLCFYCCSGLSGC